MNDKISKEEAMGGERGELKSALKVLHQYSELHPKDKPPFSISYLTDVGNARRLVTKYGEDIHYVSAWRCWMHWNGKIWERLDEDKSGFPQLLKEWAITVAESYAQDSQILTDPTLAAEYRKHAKRCESDSKIKAMLNLITAQKGIMISYEKFDMQPHLFTCQNGTLNLETGELQESQRGDYLTKVSPVEFNPDATCEVWVAFLERILLGHPELVTYLQNLAGQCMYGDTREKAFWIFWGAGGNNGKCQIKGSKVLMSSGTWKNIEDVVIGDEIVSPQIDGSHKFSKVIRTHNRFDYDVYEVREKTRRRRLLYTCAGNHDIPIIRPPLQSRNETERTLDHFEASKMAKLNNDKSSFVSFTTTAIEYRQPNSEIDPYSLGVWLGDGNFTKNGFGITTSHYEFIEGIMEAYPNDFIKPIVDYRCNGVIGHRMSVVGTFAQQLKNVKLYSMKSGTKFIPTECLLSDIEYRRKLLAGIIDTDGYIDKANAMSVSTKSEQLAKDIETLAHSLGAFSSIRKIRKGIKSIGFVGDYFDVSVQFQNKNVLPLRSIKKNRIRETAHNPRNIAIECVRTKSQQVYGIETDSPSKWYVTDNWMITHNTTFIEEVQYIIGAYGQTIPIAALLRDNKGGIPVDLHTLMGSRAAFASEPDIGDELTSGQIKRITGKDTMKTRTLNEKPSQWKAQFNLIISTNNKPKITDPSIPMWSRVKCIPFSERIPLDEQDKLLWQKLEAESAGILNWMLAGCLDWLKNGMDEPEIVTSAVQEYREESDKLSDWFEYCFDLNIEGFVPFKIYYPLYKLWCANNDIRHVADTTLRVMLRDRGFQIDRGTFTNSEGEKVRERGAFGFQLKSWLTGKTEEKGKITVLGDSNGTPLIKTIIEAVDTDFDYAKRQFGQWDSKKQVDSIFSVTYDNKVKPLSLRSLQSKPQPDEQTNINTPTVLTVLTVLTKEYIKNHIISRYNKVDKSVNPEGLLTLMVEEVVNELDIGQYDDSYEVVEGLVEQFLNPPKVSQRDFVKSVRECIRSHQNDTENGAELSVVLSEIGGDAAKITYAIHKLKSQGEIMEKGTDCYRIV